MKIRQLMPLLLLPLAGVVQAQAIKTEPPVQTFTTEEVEAIPMPEIAFEYSSVKPKDFEKYFFFHRPDTSFDAAYADILECDSLGSGVNFYSGGLGNAFAATPGLGVLGAGLGGAIGSAIGDAIFGSAERRKLKRINIRTCMYYKGYDRYGLKKDLWQEFHFEEGLSRENADDRAAALKQQARVASGPKTHDGGAGTMIARMKRAYAALTAPALALAFAMPGASLQAQEAEAVAIELKKVEKGSQTLSEDKAYIYIRSSQFRSNGVFLKKPDADDITAYEEDWREKFEKAVKRYPKKLERWKKNAAMSRNPGPRPVEPTEENFSIGAIETRMAVSFGPQFVYAKGKDAGGEKFFEYLMEVEPAEYTFYGPLFLGPEGAFGQCYCMGSFKFEAKAGQITSLGDFLMGNWVTPEALKQVSIFADTLPDRSGKPADYTVPDSLSALPSAPAELFAAGKMNNFYRAGVARMPPIPGVLRYERDTVIDVKAEIAAAEAAEAQAKAEAEAAERAKAEAAALAVAAAAEEAAAKAEEVIDAAASEEASEPVEETPATD